MIVEGGKLGTQYPIIVPGGHGRFVIQELGSGTASGIGAASGR
ncbi:hypothetical protein [Aidingimonas lacisalsi]|nr:hypothetical protein [Aidingimonas lacisalsi]